MIVEIFEIATGLEMVVPSTEKLQGILAEMFLIAEKDFMTFHVFLILFQLDSK